MNNKLKIGILSLVIFTLGLLFISCSNDSSESIHEHEYDIKFDDTYHYEECSCGKIINKEEHTFEWVLDKPVSTTEEGIKHLECPKCGLKKEENTIIEKLPDDQPSQIITLGFTDYMETKNFLENSDPNISWLCLKGIDNSKYDITSIDSFDYSFSYSGVSDGKYLDSHLSILLSYYSSALGNDADSYDDIRHSITYGFEMVGFKSTSKELSFTFERYSNSNSIYNNVIHVYCGGVFAGDIYYFTGLNIEQSYIEQFLRDNLTIINNN